MKIKITEIEATADDLRACNTLADGLANILRNCFIPREYAAEYDDAGAQLREDDDEDDQR